MSFQKIAFVLKKNLSKNIVEEQILSKKIKNISVFNYDEEFNKNEYDFIEYEVSNNKERAIWLDFSQTTREFGMYDEEYEPPKLGDKHSLLRTKEQARIDGIGIHLDELDEKCAKVNRGEVIATLTRIKQNALSQRNARQIIALYDSSMNLEELLNYSSEIYAIKYGLNVEHRTKDWVLGRWDKFLEEESFSPRTKNIKAFKTRLKNIVKDGKKISSLYYFADWLLEQESVSNEAPF